MDLSLAPLVIARRPGGSTAMPWPSRTAPARDGCARTAGPAASCADLPGVPFRARAPPHAQVPHPARTPAPAPQTHRLAQPAHHVVAAAVARHHGDAGHALGSGRARDSH